VVTVFFNVSVNLLLPSLIECYVYHCSWAPLRPSDSDFGQNRKPGLYLMKTSIYLDFGSSTLLPGLKKLSESHTSEQNKIVLLPEFQKGRDIKDT
jgi:hypothetical protein